MPDEKFDNPRLAAIYDALDPDRGDLVHYVAMVDEFGVSSVLDVGCGTGSLAVLLAERGVNVVGVEPAAASVAVARGKPFADRVRWIDGDATTLPTDVRVDLAVMTGNVAQVFTSDDDWNATLAGIRGALGHGGRFVFETRDPARRAWDKWTEEHTRQRVDIPGVGVVEEWVQVTEVALPFVTFESPNVFLDSGEMITSTSTLIFRDRAVLEASLAAAGFDLLEVREAPDRPGKEWVFVTQRR